MSVAGVLAESALNSPSSPSDLLLTLLDALVALMMELIVRCDCSSSGRCCRSLTPEGDTDKRFDHSLVSMVVMIAKSRAVLSYLLFTCDASGCSRRLCFDEVKCECEILMTAL